MTTTKVHPAAAKAAIEFDRHEKRTDGTQVADRLTKSLTALRESLLRRIISADQPIPLDSMLLPVSKLKAQQHAAEEVEALMIAESVVAVRTYRLCREPEEWFADWLTAMRLDSWNPLGDVPERVAGYLGDSPDERRLQFSNLLVESVPESRHAPLVLFRVFPLAVQVATALAFENPKAAKRIRAEQIKILPSIGYCQECHGALLEGNQECSTCGNPLWNQQWLCEVD